MTETPLPSSFRDPSGFLFVKDGQVFRQINTQYQGDYDRLMTTGLYDKLVRDRLLLSHEELADKAILANVYKVIKPQMVPFISYPYEWCFSQYKAAALLTLQIEKLALDHGMTLKDASAYNVQFVDSQPIFIDTLSFETYKEGSPWVAYRQFCQHFLAPLALMSKVDSRLGGLMRTCLDGIPIDLGAKLLPMTSWLDAGLLMHLAVQNRLSHNQPHEGKGERLSLQNLKAIVENLDSTIKKLELKTENSQWNDYYETSSYSATAMSSKEKLVSAWLESLQARTCWDLGANTGRFSRIAGRLGLHTVSIDSAPMSVERNYAQCVKDGETNILPLVLDLSNPSPSLGWAFQERMSLLQRGPVDVVLALALVHHLSIANNLPFSNIATFLRSICQWLIIEFVPKSDPQVKGLLANRKDIFPSYTQPCFEEDFSAQFTIIESAPIADTQRVLYRMKAKA